MASLQSIRPAWRPAVPWVLAVGFAFLAGQFWQRNGATPVFAQTPPMVGGRGVLAFPGQIDSNRYGVYMLDVDQGTLWCYELENAGGTRKLRLIAARSWIYDRYLQDFNCAEPSFRAVQELVAQQRARTDRQPPEDRRNNQSTGDGQPPSSPDENRP